jgi:hypothetical protein
MMRTKKRTGEREKEKRGTGDREESEEGEESI